MLDALTAGKISSANAIYVYAALVLASVAVYLLVPGKAFSLRPWYWPRRKAQIEAPKEDAPPIIGMGV